MPYQFAGFFAQPSVPLSELPGGAVTREVSTPFPGVGVRLPALIGKTPDSAEIQKWADKLGISAASRWLYLTYDTWGGSIDFVYGLTSSEAVLSKPVEDSSWETVEATYLTLMGQFGVGPAQARSFAPFARGFWGEGA